MDNSKSKNAKTVIMLVLLFSLAGGIIFGFVLGQVKNYTGLEDLNKFRPSIPTRIYDVNGILIAELFREKRDLVPFEALPPGLIKSFLAAEDRDFYLHIGIDPPAIVRAMIKNVSASFSAGRPLIVQGGSTITQQLAKRLFTESEKTIGRKLVEAVLALQIEKRFSKNEILEMYFNQIYLGHGCHGIASAAEFYFGKKVKDLSLIESTVLAALPSRPNGYSPLKFPSEAIEKNRDTLRRMVNAGFINSEYSDKIFREFWPSFIESLKMEFPTKTAFSNSGTSAPYFVDYVRQILISRFGEERVYTQGLDVYTTLDLERQKIAESYLAEGLREQNERSQKYNEKFQGSVDRDLLDEFNNLRLIFSLPGLLIKKDVETDFKKYVSENMADIADIISLMGGGDGINDLFCSFRDSSTAISSSLQVEGALIAVEPKTGYISSMVGGTEYNVSNQYNRAIQARRQPGSAFKPFVYGAAMEDKKINPATTLYDVPLANLDEEGVSWTPGNYGGDFSGKVMVRRALASSINIISVRIYDLIGPEKLIEYSSRMIKVPETRFNPNPSLALGANELTPFELAGAYSIYANSGKNVIPFSIRYVENRDGEEILNIENEVKKILKVQEQSGEIQVIPEPVAYVMTSLMRGVIDRGTAHDSIRAEAGFKHKAAGKTGTTTNWTDAWFCGYTSDLCTIVWVGYDHPFMSLGRHQSGSTAAAPIWARYMRDVYFSLQEPDFPPQPAGVYHVEVCKHSGFLPSPSCTETVSEMMISGSAPEDICDGKHMKMKSILERYMEKEGLSVEE